MVDDTVIAYLNDKEYTIKHEDFKKAYKKKFMLIAEKTVEYKNLRIFKAVPKQP